VIVRLVQQLKKLEDLALPAATDRILFELGGHCPHLSKFFFQVLHHHYGIHNINPPEAELEGMPSFYTMDIL